MEGGYITTLWAESGGNTGSRTITDPRNRISMLVKYLIKLFVIINY